MQKFGEIICMKHKPIVIFGAGAFSHAHLRCLKELGITECVLAKNTPWTSQQQHKLADAHPLISFTFDNKPDITDKIVHIVTPSNTHAELLYRYSRLSSKIFIEKPSVLYNKDIDFNYANFISNTVYQNDWLAQIQNHRSRKYKPSIIHFKYDVKNKNQIDHITEIWSHVINLVSLWYKPNCKIHLNSELVKNNARNISCIIDNELELNISTTSGLVEKSKWQLQIDNEEFTSEELGGSLLINTLSTMLTNKLPLTDWYNASWLIHKFRLLSSPEIFDNQFLLNYRK